MSVNLSKPLDMTPGNEAQAIEFLKSIQGNILRGHGRDHAMHLFICFGDSENESTYAASLNGAKTWIRQMADRVTSGATQQADADKTGVFVSLLLSSSGYEFLGKSRPDDDAFRDGMRDRVARLNDPPFKHWEPKYRIEEDRVHSLVIVASKIEAELDIAKNGIEDALAQFGGTILVDERGKQLRDENNHPIENFGYADGVSQPKFFNDGSPKAQKYDQRTALELVLEEDRNAPGFYGSYLVYRKLEQNIESFNAAVFSIASQLEIEPDLAGAMAIGRFKNGTPLTTYGASKNDYDPQKDENFDFNDDEEGNRCPFHAHIRKVNPRGSLGFIKDIFAQERKRRIARRGITYREADGSVGLLFMCYQRDIARQFEFIQRRWANSPSFSERGTGLDPVIGQGNGDQGDEESPQWPHAYDSDDRTTLRFGEHVRLRGGEYFHAPSIPGLANLSK